MKITKIAKVLPIAFALTVCTAFADGGTDTSTNASAQYQLTLKDYIKISTTTPQLTSTTSFGTDYESITIDTSMTGAFNVISNAKTRKMYLTGACPVTASTTGSSTGSASPLYGADSDCKNLKLVFTHTTDIPEADSITNITGGSPLVDQNPNAIAFAVSSNYTHAHGPSTTPISATWDATNNRVEYVMKNGVLDLTYEVSGSNETNTFNTQDMSGTYQATLTLTDVGAI